MGFYAILCPRPSSAPEDSYCIVIQDYLSVVSRRFYASVMYIMSQSPPSYFRIDTLSPSASTDRGHDNIRVGVCLTSPSGYKALASCPCRPGSSISSPLHDPMLGETPDIIADKVIRPHACRRPRHHPPAYKHRMRFPACKRYACETGSEGFRPTYRSDTCREDGLSRSRSMVARMLSRLDAARQSSCCKRSLLPCRSITAVGMVAGRAM